MDFGSSFVYMYDEMGYEYISDDEYEDGMRVSDSDSDDEPTFLSRKSAPAPRSFPQDEADSTIPPSLHSVPPPPPPPPPPRAPYSATSKAKKRAHWKQGILATGQKRGQKVRSGDTNIVSIKFNQLVAPSNMHAGDPQYCSGCGAILSKISKLETCGNDKVWTCEFCSARTVVDVEEEEIPQEEDVTFMLEPALSTQASGPSGLDESLVVFCVDVSGSMCVTTEVPGHVELRGAESLRRARLFNRERGDQYLPSQRRDVTYVSRLQSVQAAIDHQLQEMEKEFPNRRVALITFSNEVTVIGDGKADPVCLAGDKLGSKDALKEAAREATLPDSIKNTRKALGAKLFELEECGPTALGPALLVASTVASRVRGSKVILCTDGLANVGMGKLDNFKSEEEEEASLNFYEEIANCAADDGVAISVITIKGTDCKLVEIGKLADKTGGQVNIVDPLKLTQEFSTILANKIIATNVVSTFILHKQLFFFYEETEESKVEKKIGNVTSDTEITFEYGVRTNKKDTDVKTAESKSDAQAKNQSTKTDQDQTSSGTCQVPDAKSKMQTDEAKVDTDLSEQPGTSTAGTEAAASGGKDKKEAQKKELPFQLQIVYTDTEGAKALRVLTKVKPVTTDRQKAERTAKLDVLASHTAQQSAKMALDGKYTMSRQRALMNQRVAWRHTRDSDSTASIKREYKSKFGKIMSMENYLNARQKSERATVGHTYSDEEDEALDEVDDRHAPQGCGLMLAAPKSAEKRASKSFLSRLKKKRSETTEDDGANMVYKGKAGSKFFEDDD